MASVKSQKITPFLWFDREAEEAMNFYVSVFPHAKVGTVTRYGAAGPGPAGSVMICTFELEGQPFTALNGGPQERFNGAVSFVIDCATQAEVDHFWERLSAGGRTNRCGWLTDKFGLTWQVVPSVLPQLLSQPDPQKAQRVMQAMLQMTKLDIAALQAAAEG